MSAHSTSLNFQSVRPSIHNLRGIFADADATVRRKVRRRAIVLGGDWFRDDGTGIPFADVSPQKRRARAPGADIGGVGAFAVYEVPVSS